METAGVGLGGTVAHTLLEEKQSQDPVVEVHEISKPDSPIFSDPVEVADETDPITEPEESSQIDDTAHLPTTEESHDEPEVLESKEAVHIVDDSEPLTELPTDDEATTHPPAEEIESGPAAVEPDTEVKKEATLPEETGDIYYIIGS